MKFKQARLKFTSMLILSLILCLLSNSVFAQEKSDNLQKDVIRIDKNKDTIIDTSKFKKAVKPKDKNENVKNEKEDLKSEPFKQVKNVNRTDLSDRYIVKYKD